MAKHTIRDEIVGVLLLVGAIWCVFIVGYILPFDLNSYGITPRTLRGLIGIPAAPFLHADRAHIVSNTIPLAVLLVLLAGSKANSWIVVALIVLLGGGLLWLFGRPAIHIGASSLIYGLIAYLLVSGIREGRLVPFIIAVLVGLVYGGTLLAGIVPSLSSHISWEGHLFGAIAGGAIAYWQTRDQYREVINLL